MAFSETAQLVTELSLKDNLSRGLKGAVGSVKAFDKATAGLQKNLGNLGRDLGRGLRTGISNVVKIGTVALTGLVGALAAVTKAGAEATRVETIFAKTLANSGKFSAAQVKALRAQQDALLALTGVDDEAIKSVQTILIRFGETAAQVQKLTPLVLDLAKATGRDLESSAIAVGKAMAGQFTALQRMGITLTAAQQAALKGSTKSAKLQQLTEEKLRLSQRKSALESKGALTKAQKLWFARTKASIDARIAQEKLIIAQKKGISTAQKEAIVYDALKKKVGGVAGVLGQDLAGRIDVFREGLSNIAEGVGQKLAPALTKLADTAGRVLIPAFSKFADSVLPTVIEGINSFTGLLTRANLDKVAGVLRDIAKGVSESIPTIKGALSFSADVLKTAIGLFRSLPPDVQKIAIAALAVNKLTGGALTSVVGDLLKIGLAGLKTITAGVVNVFGGSVNSAGAGLGAAAAAGGAAGLIGTAVGLGTIALSVAAVYITAKEVNADVQGKADIVTGNRQTFQDTASTADLSKALQGLEELPGSLDLIQKTLYDLDVKGIRSFTEFQKEQLRAELARRRMDIRAGGRGEGFAPGRTQPIAVTQRFIAEERTAGIVAEAAQRISTAATLLRIAAAKQIAAAALQKVLGRNLFNLARPLRKGKRSSEVLREFGEGRSKLTPKEIVKVAGAGTKALAQGGKGDLEKNRAILVRVRDRLLKLGDKTDAAAIQRDITALNQTLINKKLDVQNNNIIQNRITVANDYTITVDGRKVAVIQNQHTDYSSASTAGRQNLPNF